jgi:hypothetical protein
MREGNVQKKRHADTVVEKIVYWGIGRIVGEK